MSRLIYLLSSTMCLAMLVFAVPINCAYAIEEPSYKVVLKEGDFELREYEPMIVAETVVTGSLKQASNRGFRQIADYIFGNNQARDGNAEKVAMTAPVTIQATSEKIAMTAPVTIQSDEGDQSANGEPRWRVHFVMPSSYSIDSLPSPSNELVSLREVPSKRVAVLRFSGLAGKSKVSTKTDALKNWVASKGWKTMEASSLARYDPPWTLPFMRRNEVHFRVEPASPAASK